jgi:hypothetical protein
MEQEDLRSDGEEEEAPILLEEVQVEEQVDEILEEEAEADAERQQIPPYQLTHYYGNELTRFDEAYLRWINERYEQERLLFEQQQEQLYNTAMVLGAQVGGQIRQQVQQDNVPLEEDVDNNIDDDDAVNNIIDPQQDVEDEIIIRYVADDEDNIAIINEDDIIIVNNDVIDEEEEAVDDPDPPPPVNCQVIKNNIEEEEEDDEVNDVVLIDEEEEQRLHLINYAISLPVVATADAGHRERRNE